MPGVLGLSFVGCITPDGCGGVAAGGMEGEEEAGAGGKPEVVAADPLGADGDLDQGEGRIFSGPSRFTIHSSRKEPGVDGGFGGCW